MEIKNDVFAGAMRDIDKSPASLVLERGATDELVHLTADLMGGSGFDSFNGIEETRRNILMYYGYHAMDENGSYDAWVDIRVRFPRDNPQEFKVEFLSAQGRRYAERHGLREYFNDVVFCALERAAEEMGASIRKPSCFWHARSGWKVVDPDGWDRSNMGESFYKEAITWKEYKRREAMSTKTCKSDDSCAGMPPEWGWTA